MTGLTDVRDRTLTMLRALGVEPDNRQMRTVERYVRWVDGQISAAHIDGRALERETAGGHEIVVEHDTGYGGSVYAVACREPAGADCRLACTVRDCEDSAKIRHDARGPHHLHVSDPDDAVTRHDMADAGYCNVVVWLENDIAGVDDLAVDDQGSFEIGRFRIKPVWTGDGFQWRRDTPPETVPPGGV